MKKLMKKSFDALAEKMPVIPEIEQKNFIGGGDGSAGNPYTQFEFDQISDSGSWCGGYVEEWGYVAPTVYVFGGTGNYYTLPEYIQSLSGSGINQLSGWVLDGISGGISSYYEQEIGDLHRDMQSELVTKGYGADSWLYVQQESDGRKNITYRVYDATTGQLITSRVMNTFGFWH